ncbi:hypothetical protein WAF17_21190 [Bernardetia sp. ABR2-2B]|uniref:hypothetical protein n=1 Tax=Bernardetia sp. ABR2-2B TaxID=3127472 RepID=UPI0030CB3F71
MLVVYFLPYALMILFFAFASSSLTRFIHFCLGIDGDGIAIDRIFSKLGVWIYTKYNYQEDKNEGVGLNIWSILTCIVCFNFYVNLFIFLLTLWGGFFVEVRWYWIFVWFICQSSISSFFTRKFSL